MTDNIIVRETDEAVFYSTEWQRNHNAQREIRKQAGEKMDSWDRKIQPTKAVKYLCIGGPLHGQRLAWIQMPDIKAGWREYYDYNLADGTKKQFKMVRLHCSILGLGEDGQPSPQLPRIEYPYY